MQSMGSSTGVWASLLQVCLLSSTHLADGYALTAAIITSSRIPSMARLCHYGPSARLGSMPWTQVVGQPTA